jgi:hypothetical protein
MRRRVAALIVSVLALGLAFASPWGAVADQCSDRVVVYSRNANSPLLFDLRGTGCRAGQNTARLVPGSDQIQVLVNQTSKQPVPVGGTYTTDSKTAEIVLKPNAADPQKASKHESGYLPIGATNKVEVLIQFADGTETKINYTR